MVLVPPYRVQCIHGGAHVPPFGCRARMCVLKHVVLYIYISIDIDIDVDSPLYLSTYNNGYMGI